MKERKFELLLICAVVISAFSGAYSIIMRHVFLHAQAVSVTVSARVIPLSCGNGSIDSGEQCDGANLNNLTCASFGYTGGGLSCNVDCTINASACFMVIPPGGGGGGGGAPPSSVTQVTFRGTAYPGSPIVLLRDGQQVARVTASPDAHFEFNLSGLSGGVYTFSVYSQDARGTRSVLNTFAVDITNGISTVVSGIFIPPTIVTDKSHVKQGDPIIITGASAPSSTVNLSIHSSQIVTSTVTTGADGIYTQQLDSSLLSYGDHSAMAKTTLNGVQSPYSAVAFFKVGDSNVYTQSYSCMRADLNCDGKVNLVDFSILAYWYKRPLTAEAEQRVDLNMDGKVDLIDFSIMAYYWTG
ncbi:MAG: dockerin type I domain-containing protein [Candidatus Paceibacterota bacterium]|jgi:hypothetical protein